jgi:hypothetical protein
LVASKEQYDKFITGMEERTEKRIINFSHSSLFFNIDFQETS